MPDNNIHGPHVGIGASRALAAMTVVFYYDTNRFLGLHHPLTKPLDFVVSLP